MATRHNGCPNPCLTNDDAGWTGGADPTRQAVTGFDRPFAARYTSGTFSQTPPGACVAEQPCTLSQWVYIANASPTISGTFFVEWKDSDGNVISYGSGNYSLPGQTVSRISVTLTAPAGAATGALIAEGYNFSNGPGDVTMALIEPVATLEDYFDGDSPGGSWDGTPGNSASTLTDTVTGTLDGSLPPFSGTFEGEATAWAGMVGALPAFTADFAGQVEASGTVDASLPALSGVLDGDITVSAELGGTLPALSMSAAGEVVLPRGPLVGTLPALQVAFVGSSDVVELDIEGLVGSPETRWPVGAPETRFLVGAPYV